MFYLNIHFSSPSSCDKRQNMMHFKNSHHREEIHTYQLNLFGMKYRMLITCKILDACDFATTSLPQTYFVKCYLLLV